MACNFPDGANGSAVSKAPYLRFDRRDMLRARRASEAHGVDLEGPIHWIPSTHGFLDLALAGLTWVCNRSRSRKPIYLEQLGRAIAESSCRRQSLLD